MKKIVFLMVSLFCLVASANAQLLIGARPGGMGGAGVASTKDLTSVYYNPAGLMQAGAFEFRLSAAPSYTQKSYQQVMDAFSKATDISKFLQDNYANDLSFSGDVAGLIGLNIAKVGVTAIALPLGNYAGDVLAGTNSINFNKPANQLQGSANYGARYDYVLTLGHSFSTPFLPASLDAAVNLKAINATYGTLNAAVTDTSSTHYKGTGTGTAFDVGLKANVNLPFLASAAVGVTMRDLSGQINYKRKSETYYFNTSLLTPTVTKGAESDLADKSVPLDSSTAIGIAGQIPVINLGVAADIEMSKNDTITHLGLEYPLFMNLLTLRAGLASGNSVAKTTLGAKINLPILAIEAASIMDSKNSSFTGWIADIALGF